MSKQEKIVCAAVRTNEHGTKIRLYVKYPEHIKKDKQVYGVFGECSHEKGFITNKNRFVDAKEAMRIAVDNKVVSDFYFKKEILELILSREHAPKNTNIRIAGDIEITHNYDDVRKRLGDIKDRIDKGLLPEDLY